MASLPVVRIPYHIGDCDDKSTAASILAWTNVHGHVHAGLRKVFLLDFHPSHRAWARIDDGSRWHFPLSMAVVASKCGLTRLKLTIPPGCEAAAHGLSPPTGFQRRWSRRVAAELIGLNNNSRPRISRAAEQTSQVCEDDPRWSTNPGRPIAIPNTSLDPQLRPAAVG